MAYEAGELVDDLAARCLSASQLTRVSTDQISGSLLHGAKTLALADLLDTDLLEPLQTGRHGTKHRIGPVDPHPAIA
jgi:hypothetical protein